MCIPPSTWKTSPVEYGVWPATSIPTAPPTSPGRPQRAMGASPMQIVFKVLLAEARPAILLAFTMTIVSLIGYSAMVGAVGGGGLGDLGIRYGYQRFMPEVMLAVVVVLIVLVQLVQSAGDALARRFDKRNRKS